MNKICLCLTRKTLEADLNDIRTYRTHIDLVELRFDLLEYTSQNLLQIYEWKQVHQNEIPPMIFTNRLIEDGGTSTKTHSEQYELLKEAIDSEVFEFIDVEATIIQSHDGQILLSHHSTDSSSSPKKTSIIVSRHNFSHNATAETFDHIHHYLQYYTQPVLQQKKSRAKRSPEVLQEHIRREDTSIDQYQQSFPQGVKPTILIKYAARCDTLAHLAEFFDQCSRLQKNYIPLQNADSYHPSLQHDSTDHISYNKDSITTPYIAIAMGDYGLPSRILTPHTGSAWTYTSAPDAPSAASGQLSPSILCTRYRYKTLSARTSLFAIVGNPVSHSRSPEFHNKIFAEHDKDACYIPLLTDQCSDLLALIHHMPFRGLSVTTPHKLAIRNILTKEDSAVTQTQSCNTVIIDPETYALHGYELDSVGFTYALREWFVQTPTATATAQVPPSSTRTALILGAGGSSKPICMALLSLGYRCILTNRSYQKAIRLVQSLTQTHRGYPSPVEPPLITSMSIHDIETSYHRLSVDLVVNTTSAGMDGISLPIQLTFKGNERVYDIIYTPSKTPLLKKAESHGCQTLNGASMFTQQAQAQSRLFLNQLQSCH